MFNKKGLIHEADGQERKKTGHYLWSFVDHNWDICFGVLPENLASHPIPAEPSWLLFWRTCPRQHGRILLLCAGLWQGQKQPFQLPQRPAPRDDHCQWKCHCPCCCVSLMRGKTPFDPHIISSVSITTNSSPPILYTSFSGNTDIILSQSRLITPGNCFALVSNIKRLSYLRGFVTLSTEFMEK